jgi:hypothetical protein
MPQIVPEIVPSDMPAAPEVDEVLRAEIRRVAWLRHSLGPRLRRLRPEHDAALEAAIWHGLKLLGRPGLFRRIDAIETLRAVTREWD